MWSAIILFMVLGQPPSLAKSKVPYQSEEACQDAMAKVMNDIRPQVDLITGKCVEGDGTPS